MPGIVEQAMGAPDATAPDATAPDATAPDDAEPSTGKPADLEALKEKIDGSVPKEFRRGYNQTMAAGMKLMFSDQTYPQMQQYLSTIKSPDQIPQVVAHGILKAISILANQSKGQMPIESMGAAAQGLATQALEYLQKVKGMPIDNDAVAATTKAVAQGVTHLIQQYGGLNDDQMQQVLQGKAKDLIAQDRQNPQAGAQPGAAQPGAAQPGAAQPGASAQQPDASAGM